MAYIVSARKYRPLTFEDVVGQEQITSTLKRAIESDHLAQAFLFCGPRGVGKTTCARILAKAVNTGKTEKLHEIEEDFSFNIFELDAASNNKVDDMHQLMAQVRIPPQTGKYKIYIIDEVHMLSQAAFNAFLKTLEEPPPYAIFILATTEKHKILPTILSRCQIYDFRRISVPDIVKHLESIASQENISAEDGALHIIAEKADGALRDALSIFDRLVSYSGDNLSYEAAVKSLNVLDYDYFFKLVNFLAIEDISSSFLLLNEVIELGFESDHFIHGMSAHLRNLLVCKDPKTIQLLEVSQSLKERYLSQASLIPTNFIINALSLASEADVQYKQSLNKRLLVELMLMKIALHTNLINTAKTTAHNSSQEKKTLNLIQNEPISPKNIELSNTNVQASTPSEKEKPSPTLEKKTEDLVQTTTQKKTSFSIDLSDLEKEVEEELKTKEKKIVTKNQSIQKEDEKPQTALDGDRLSIETLIPVWDKMLLWFQESHHTNLFETLNDHKPHLVGKNICITLDSKVEQAIVENKIRLIKGFLNRNFTKFEDIVFKISESDKSKKPILNQKAKFEKLCKRNPKLLDLKNILGLELEL